MKYLFLFTLIIFSSLVLTACLNKNENAENMESQEAAPPVISYERTQIIPYDPNAVELKTEQTPQTAECEASVAVPREGAYKCQLSEGANVDPCFLLDSGQLLCGPNPAMNTYLSLATASNLPKTENLAGEPVPFQINIDLGSPLSCDKLGEVEQVGQFLKSYNCNAPASAIIGELNISNSVWSGFFITQDSGSGEVTSGPEPKPIIQAWVY